MQQANERSQSQSQENERPMLSQNIFMKNDNYCNILTTLPFQKKIIDPKILDYSDEVKQTKIFQKFYYENFKLEDLKEYILPAFRKVKGAQNYFEILFAEAKNFGYVIFFCEVIKYRY